MKRTMLLSVLAILLVCFLTACGGSEEPAVNEHEGEVLTPVTAEEFVGKDYKEVVQIFRAAGFTNIKEEPVEDLITGWMTKDGEVETVTVGGDEAYTSGVWVPEDIEVVVVYHTFKGEETEKPKDAQEETAFDVAPEEQVSETVQVETAVPADDNITVENNADFARIISDNTCSYSDYSAFAAANQGKTIEFDGSIDYVENYKDYDTRYDFLLSAGPYDENHQTGPTFKFENEAASLIDTAGNAPGYLQAGQNVRIKATVLRFDDNTGIFFLRPVLLTY